MGQSKKTIFEAATLILLSRSSQKISNLTNNFQVLMVQRSSRSSFMPQAGAFPGGMIDKADFSNDWKNIYEKCVDWENLIEGLPKTCNPRTPLYTRSRDSNIPADIGLRISAIRETFEESGILLLRKANDDWPVSNSAGVFARDTTIPDEERKRWRITIHQNATKFMDLCRELQAVPDVWSLHEWNNWFTPPGFAKRFDTAFYLCCMEHMEHVSEDAKEVKKVFWTPPLDVLKRHANKELLLFPPQNLELSRLLNFDSLEQVLEFSYYRARNYPTLLHLPMLIKCKDGKISVLPGDSLYPLELSALQNYEGTPEDDTLIIDRNTETTDHVNNISKNLYRSVFPNENLDKPVGSHDSWSALYCNIKTPDGHKQPQLFWLRP